MSKYQQDAESLLPDVTPCGDDLLSTLSPFYTQTQKNRSQSPKSKQPWGQFEEIILPEWTTTMIFFLALKHRH